MDFNPDKRRIDDAYNEYVAGLAEHIEAGLDDALSQFKKSQKIREGGADQPPLRGVMGSDPFLARGLTYRLSSTPICV